MRMSVISLLCLAAVLVVCQAKDYRTFLRGLQGELRHELAKEEITEFTKLAELTEDLHGNKSCNCGRTSCSCCVDIRLRVLPPLHVCGNASFDRNIAVDIAIIVNGEPVWTTKITSPKPPRVCKKIKNFEVCLFFDHVSIDLNAKTFFGCVNFKFSIGPAVKLGCFQLPPKSQHHSNRNQKPGL
ncbi:uncharacterized protein LOC117317899 [Pecten maximus]|uniref:uncharacterized protein LOC117317899 n=1 Tax=Pecten maximus TaxID=6579 RepID=UPI001458C159|nr:uncharacterized protein LOC117317899 [Pecten maximus]